MKWGYQFFAELTVERSPPQKRNVNLGNWNHIANHGYEVDRQLLPDPQITHRSYSVPLILKNCDSRVTVLLITDI